MLFQEVIDKSFCGTASRIGGVTFNLLLEETFQRHEIAFGEKECDARLVISFLLIFTLFKSVT